MQAKYDSKAIKLLHNWFRERKISFSDFGISIGCTYRLVWTWIKGTSQPSLQNAIKIEKITKGAVKCSEWAIDDLKIVSKKKESSKKVSKKPPRST